MKSDMKRLSLPKDRPTVLLDMIQTQEQNTHSVMPNKNAHIHNSRTQCHAKKYAYIQNTRTQCQAKQVRTRTRYAHTVTSNWYTHIRPTQYTIHLAHVKRT